MHILDHPRNLPVLRAVPCRRCVAARQPQIQWPWLSRASSNPAPLLTWEFCGANYTDSPPAAEFAMRLMKEPRGGLFSWCSYFSNYPLFLVPRVAVKRLQSKIIALLIGWPFWSFVISRRDRCVCASAERKWRTTMPRGPKDHIRH